MEECVQHQTHVTVQVLDSLVTSVKYKVPSLLLFMSGWIQRMFFISDDTTDGERTKLQQLFLCIQWNPSMRTPLNRTPFPLTSQDTFFHPNYHCYMDTLLYYNEKSFFCVLIGEVNPLYSHPLPFLHRY